MKKLLLILSTSILSGQIAPPSSSVFDKDSVHEIRLTFKQPDWYEQLTTTYNNFRDNTPYLEGSLVWGQYKFDSVGVRFKGNSSYNGARTRKKPFRIKLNEFVKGQKIDKMASFSLSNGWNDPSFIREKAYYELADKAGLPAARSNFAALYVNDEYLGLYILGEVVNGDFLDNHFAKADSGGNLYKADEPGANLAYLGDDPVAYQQTFSKESNEEENDWSDLVELARVFGQTPASELPSKLNNLIDVDSFLTALALDNLTVNTDSYVGMAQNYYLYRRSSDRKWVWIPWDPSLAFGALGQGSNTALPLEWVQSTSGRPGGGGGFPGGIGGEGRPIATKLWEIPEYKQRYREIYQRLVDQVLIPTQLIGRMNALRELIWPWVEKDTQKLVTMAQFEAAMKGSTAAGGPGMIGALALEPFIEARMISVKAQLAGRPLPVISSSPASLIYAQVSGASDAGSQDIVLSLPEGVPATEFSAAASAPWIALTGGTGAFPGKVNVRVNVSNWPAGTHNGSINITAPGMTNSPLAIPVTLIVAPSSSIVASPSSLTFLQGEGQGGGGAMPGALTQTIRVLSTSGASPFAIAVSDSTCNNFLSITPSSGSTPATVTVSSTANNASGSCAARLNISSAGLASAVVPITLQQINSGGGGFPGLPSITAVVNSASYKSGAVSPGTLVTLFGANLGTQNLTRGSFANGEMSTNVGGMQITFDGTPAPILYTRSDQTAVAVPFEVAGKSQVTVAINMTGQGGFPGGRPNIPGATFQMNVGGASPGLYTSDSTGRGQAAIVNEAGSMNSPSAPATRGSIVSIYLTGAGALTPAGKSGAAGTADQRIAAPLAVSIGGQDARVTYAGAAPGSLQGLYQVNAVVPATVAPGSAPVQVTVDGVSSQSDVTMIVR